MHFLSTVGHSTMSVARWHGIVRCLTFVLALEELCQVSGGVAEFTISIVVIRVRRL